MLKYTKFLIVLVVLAIGAFLIFVYSGIADVSATSKDGAFMRWTLGTIRERSIERRLGDTQVPALDDPAAIVTGAHHYHAMCEQCHLAPGVTSSELRDGLNPKPPVLARVVPYSTPAELFWVVKHGIKMTGMPAWGVTHDDQKLWDIVAFLQRLPKMTPQEYQSLVATTGQRPEAAHEHPEHAHQESD